MTKRETLDFQVRFDGSAEAGEIVGYAARFGKANRHKEIIRPGAFRATILEHRAAGISVPMLWSHNPEAVIGAWNELREDGTGLLVTGRIVTETRAGAEAYALVKAGAVSGISIGFRARQQQRTAGGVRELIDVELGEISLVAMPSEDAARITSHRHQSDRGRAVVPIIEAVRSAARAFKRKP